MQKILEFILDILIPKSKELQELEALTPEEFRETVDRKRLTVRFSASKNTFILFDYQEPIIKKAIWELKYHGNTKIAKLLASLLYEELIELIQEKKLAENFERPLLISIPNSKKRLFQRGWNQCELLANELEKIDNNNFFEIKKNTLIRSRHTESQTKKSRMKRLENLKNCFEVTHPELIHNRNIILIDDVLTTGATLEEAKNTLLKANCKRVICTALAH